MIKPKRSAEQQVADEADRKLSIHWPHMATIKPGVPGEIRAFSLPRRLRTMACQKPNP
jgi:hypothetical protein